MVDFAVGTACNNCCIMCTMIMPPLRGGWNRSPEEIRKAIRSFSKNEDKVVVTGGEATIRPDFFSILRFIRSEMPNSKISLLSNGRMFSYPKFAAEFIATKCDSVAIPLHAPNARLHDRITRAPGSFNQTARGIKNLLEYNGGVEVEIRVVIHKLNYRHLPAIAGFISKEFRGIKRVVLFPIDLIGNANANRKRLIVKMTALRPFLERALGILEKNGFESSLFHIPFCVIGSKHWKDVAGRTVEDRRITFGPCDGCIMREKCPGIWRTYAFRVGTAEFKPIHSAPKTIYTKSPNLKVR